MLSALGADPAEMGAGRAGGLQADMSAVAMRIENTRSFVLEIIVGDRGLEIRTESYLGKR